MRLLIKVFFLIILGGYNVSIFAQTTYTQSARPEFNITKIETDPQIDGSILSDSVWMQIPAITDLNQIRPNYGEPGSEKTEVRVTYSKTHFYVGVVCFDTDPQSIVISDSRRDSNLDDEDSFLFIVDTYNDQQNGFLFGTNPNGMEYDAQIDNEGRGNFNQNRTQQSGVVGGTNLNWDATWEVKTEIGDYGWSAEFAIPLRSLRFSSGNNKTWGINFQRNISKTTEVVYWAQLPLGFDLKRLSLAGKMHGLDLLNPGNLKVIPYALMQTVRNKVPDPADTNTDFEFGADVKYSITPSLTLDLTYNTDFAQVEVDDQQLNLDRFNLFFPEKRPFFLENAGQFSVGSPGEVDLFFSRRIGISDDGALVPIIGGARLSGKIGQTNVGALTMFTEDVDELGIDKNNFTVARVNHDFATSRSSIGGVFVSRSGLGDMEDNHNEVYAVDGRYGLGKKAQLSGFFAKSNTPGISSKDYSFKGKAEYNWNGWLINGAYTEVGQGFNPEVGFLQRSAFKKPEGLIFKSHRLENWGNMLEIRPHVSYRGYWDFDGNQITGFLHIDNHWVWKSGFEIHTGINFTQEGVLNAFSLQGVTVDPGEYNHEELQLVYMTNPNKPLSISGRTIIGGYFGGDRISNSGTAKLRIGDKFNSEYSISHNKLDLPNGDVTAVVNRFRLAYSFTPRMFLQGLVQHNNISNVFSVNARFSWLQNANTGLFVVVNIIKDDDALDELNNQSLTIKYTHRFDLMRN